MSTTLTTTQRRLAAAVASLCLVLSSASPALARAAGEDPKPASGKTVVVEPRIGDTPADFGKTVLVPQAKIGDTPADFGKVVSVPQPIEIVRPERTIIRDVDPVLPIVLSGVALLVALAGGLQTLSQRRALRVH
jgi:hypothetical protein